METKDEVGRQFELSAVKCIERTRREHEELLAEFNSLMAGVEATLGATGMSMRRMTHEDMFLEIKRALHPLGNDTRAIPAAGRIALVRERAQPDGECQRRGRTGRLPENRLACFIPGLA